jgi:hypothetical protein
MEVMHRCPTGPVAALILEQIAGCPAHLSPDERALDVLFDVVQKAGP